MGKSANKYTLLRTLSRFIGLIYKSLDAWKIMLIYGAVITFLYYIMSTTQFICNQTNVACFLRFQIIIAIILLFVCFCYLYDFYQNVFKNTVFKYFSIVKFDKNKIKSIGFLLFYVLCFVLSASIAKYIVFKPANPNWKIEFIYFVVLFIFCMLPILAMRFSAIVAFYFNDLKLPSLNYLYEKTSGHSFIGIVGFLLTMLIMAVFNMQAYGYVTHFTTKYPTSVTVEVLATFFDILVKLFTLNVMFCFFEAQRQLMSESDLSDSVAKQEAEPIEVKKSNPVKTKKEKQIKTGKKSHKK